MDARWIVLGSIVAGTVVASAACNDGDPTLGSGAAGAGTPGTGAGMTTSTSTTQEELDNDCQTYCSAQLASCTELNQQYGDDDDCVDVCSHWPPGNPGQTNANTLACRNYYLKFADDSPDDAESNCRFAGPHTEGKCGDNCANFCFLAQKICTGDLAQWPSEAACREDCQDWPNNQPYYINVEGDNFGCRMKYLTIAADNANVTTCGRIQGQGELCEDPPIPMGGMGGMPLGGMGGVGGEGGVGGMGVGGMGLGGTGLGGNGGN